MRPLPEMFMKPLFLALFALAAIPTAAGAQLNSAERKMIAAVEAEQQRSVQLLEKLVNQNSGTLNFAGVEEVGRMMRAELEPLGFHVRWIDMKEAGRAGHIVATHKGNGRGKRMLLIAHLDTVFEPSSPFKGFKAEGNRAIGPGIGDDKGGMVVIVAALRAMQAAGTLKNADIMVVLTGDEEKVGAPLEAARRDLIEAGKWADVSLEFENLSVQDGQEMGSIARRSSANWTLRTSGRTGHSSGIFSNNQGYGAVFEMARILDAFRQELPEPNLTFNIGVVGGGTPAEMDKDEVKIAAEGKTNIIPETAIARGDLRTLTEEQDARVRARMQAIVANSLPQTKAELVFSASAYPPMAPTEGNRALLTRLNVVNRDMGLPEMAEMDPARRGAADSSFVAKYTDGLAGLGASGGGAHAEGEFVNLDSIPRQAKRVAILMSRLAREKRP
jgi:glutamate carboxypeptidase